MIDPKSFASQPPLEDTSAWRTYLTDYYSLNAPNKCRLVNQNMMDKYKGKYDKLFANLVSKYGEPGCPIEQLVVAAPVRSGSAGAAAGGRSGPSGRGGSKEIGDYYDDFVGLIAKAQASVPEAVIEERKVDPNAKPMLDTSSFTVCLRVRPLLFDEVTDKGECFNAIIPGSVNVDSAGRRTEEALVCSPAVGITGRPKIDSKGYAFDHVFGPEREGDDVFGAIGRPLVERALKGQVGVVFAFGQTGSGKTHTMNGIMDRLVNELFEGGGAGRKITFSYMEMLGREINDCLSETQSEGSKKVQVGELLDGRSVVKNLSIHEAPTAESLGALFDVAKAKRTTAATEKNATSSRSHGVGIIRVGHEGYAEGEGPVAGTLYVIDLAGSERAADSKDHSKERMDETKEINLSLMSLKECIRARTMASAGGGDVHVPYRRSKLTLLMKDVFDIGCSRMCSTVVLAHVAPAARDIKHSTNTVKYAAPLRVAVGVNRKLERDAMDPVNWSNDEVLEWAMKVSDGKVDGSALLPGGETGLDLCQTSEVEIYRRLARQPEVAKTVYQALWTLICDAKVRKRRPDGSIITPEQEAEEIRRAAEEQEAKIKLWAEREKHMRSEF